MTNPQFLRWDISATHRPSQHSALYSCSAKPCADGKGPRAAPGAGTLPSSPSQGRGGKEDAGVTDARGFADTQPPARLPVPGNAPGGGGWCPRGAGGRPTSSTRGVFAAPVRFCRTGSPLASGRPVPCKHPPRPRGRQSPVEWSERSPSPHSPRCSHQRKGGLREIIALPSAGKF